MTTFNPKPEIFTALKALGYTCLQGSQETFSKVPAITFSIGDKSARYELDNTPSAYDVEVVVDVWANDSVTTSRIANEVEVAMRGIDYRLTYSADVAAPEGTLCHTSLRFAAVKLPN